MPSVAATSGQVEILDLHFGVPDVDEIIRSPGTPTITIRDWPIIPDVEGTVPTTVPGTPLLHAGTVRITVAGLTNTAIGTGLASTCDPYTALGIACASGIDVPVSVSNIGPGPKVCLDSVIVSVDVDDDGVADFEVGTFMPKTGECANPLFTLD